MFNNNMQQEIFWERENTHVREGMQDTFLPPNYTYFGFTPIASNGHHQVYSLFNRGWVDPTQMSLDVDLPKMWVVNSGNSHHFRSF